MLHKGLFVIGYTFKNKDFLKNYNFVKKNEFESYENLKRYQKEKLQKLIRFSYNNVPYYSKLFKNLNLKPEDIQSMEDLQKLPILTKKIIRNIPFLHLLDRHSFLCILLERIRMLPEVFKIRYTVQRGDRWMKGQRSC